MERETNHLGRTIITKFFDGGSRSWSIKATIWPASSDRHEQPKEALFSNLNCEQEETAHSLAIQQVQDLMNNGEI